MANDYLGLFNFGQQPDPRQAEMERRRQQIIQMSQNTAHQNIGAQQAMGAANAAQGIGTLARGAVGAVTGADVRSDQQKLAAVRAQVAAALKGTDMQDPDKVYPVLIRVLQQAGLVPQAMAAAREYEEIKKGRRTEERSVRELERREVKDANDARLRELKLQQYDPRSPLNKAIDQLAALRAKRDALPEGSRERANADRAIEVMESNLMKAHKGSVKSVDLTDRVQIINSEDGTVIREIPKGVSPKDAAKASAKSAAAAAADEDAVFAADQALAAIDRLLTNKRVTSVAGATGLVASKTPGLEAYTVAAEIESLGGRVFLTAIQKLKEASRTGGTGLGALSDAEGARIVSSAGQVKPGTSDESLLNSLTEIRVIFQRARDKAAASAKNSAAAPTPAAPTATPAAPTAGGSVQQVNGVTIRNW